MFRQSTYRNFSRFGVALLPLLLTGFGPVDPPSEGGGGANPWSISSPVDEEWLTTTATIGASGDAGVAHHAFTLKVVDVSVAMAPVTIQSGSGTSTGTSTPTWAKDLAPPSGDWPTSRICELTLVPANGGGTGRTIAINFSTPAP